MPLIARVLVAIVLLLLAAICVVGYLASFEPPGFLVWRIAYGVGGLLALGGAVAALFAGSRRG